MTTAQVLLLVWVVAVVVCSVVGAVVREDRRPKKPKPAVVPLSDEEFAIRYWEDRYVRGEVDVDELEAGVERALRGEGFVPSLQPGVRFLDVTRGDEEERRARWLENMTSPGGVIFLPEEAPVPEPSCLAWPELAYPVPSRSVSHQLPPRPAWVQEWIDADLRRFAR